MKKFETKEVLPDNWIVSHNEFPKFICHFENRKFNICRILNGLDNPMGNPSEVRLLQKMEQWLLRSHKEKMI